MSSALPSGGDALFFSITDGTALTAGYGRPPPASGFLSPFRHTAPAITRSTATARCRPFAQARTPCFDGLVTRARTGCDATCVLYSARHSYRLLLVYRRERSGRARSLRAAWPKRADDARPSTYRTPLGLSRARLRQAAHGGSHGDLTISRSAGWRPRELSSPDCCITARLSGSISTKCVPPASNR